MQSSVSVIIPAYNARKYLRETLESAGKQTLPPLEVLVVDDASPEPVDDIVAEFEGRAGYPEIRLLKHEENRGQAAARNTAIREARGEWLAFLDSDDLWAPDHLENVLGALEKEGGDLGFCAAILFDRDPRDPDNFRLGLMAEDERRMRPLAMLNRTFIITSSVVARADVVLSVGGFDESAGMRGVEDADLFLRMMQKGAVFRMAPDATLYYRKHPESATCRTGYLARQSVAVKQRHVAWVEGTAREKRRIMLDVRWNAAIELWLAGENDRGQWLFQALARSLAMPVYGARWFARFLRRCRSNPDNS